jgi:ethanolamine ammonia-lyase small subunit
VAPDLRRFTPARVATGRTGHSLPVRELLAFQLDHARARDAVYEPLDPAAIPGEHLLLHSRVRSREEYLRRPDLGRRLSDDSRALLVKGDWDAVLVVADGLSAKAVHRHAGPLLAELSPLLQGWRVAPVCVVSGGRVAIGDEIGEACGARMVVMMIGERPGLTSPDSLGIYMTWEPRVGRSDAERNCISNVRPEGLGYGAAARLLELLMRSARAHRVSGVQLGMEKRLEG